MQVIFLGPPGVGKGTQSLITAEKLGLFHLSTGDVLRQAAADKTELGLKAKEIMEKGELVPDDVMIGLVRDAISKKEMRDKGFILDGFPRTIAQAEALDGIFVLLGYSDVKVVNITADNDEIIKRLLGRGRRDDTIETVKHRLEVYNKQTAPVKEYYSKKYIVFDINGVGSVQDINDKIMEALTTYNIKTN